MLGPVQSKLSLESGNTSYDTMKCYRKDTADIICNNKRLARGSNRSIDGMSPVKRQIDAELKSKGPPRNCPPPNRSEYRCICVDTPRILWLKWHPLLLLLLVLVVVPSKVDEIV